MSESTESTDGCSDRSRDIVRRLDELIKKQANHPLYSKELADHVGVSIRTLQDATRAARNMSLHAYVRWIRLLAVRAKLQRDETSVKAAAMECGFWHMGDFSRRYHERFGELPSDTLRLKAHQHG
jgi:transcriptional regulator GlxA family with amidase domain